MNTADLPQTESPAEAVVELRSCCRRACLGRKGRGALGPGGSLGSFNRHIVPVRQGKCGWLRRRWHRTPRKVNLALRPLRVARALRSLLFETSPLVMGLYDEDVAPRLAC